VGWEGFFGLGAGKQTVLAGTHPRSLVDYNRKSGGIGKKPAGWTDFGASTAKNGVS